jgi:tetratricopeptide (TPR) repeat protein
MPVQPESRFNLGNALIDLDRFEEAAEQYRRAVELRPGYHEAFYQLANCLVALRRDVEAEETFRQALALHPAYAEAHHNLANLMRRRGRTGMALSHYRAALRANPMLAEGHYNLGHCLLQLGQFSEGLACYEWRWRTAEFKPRRCPQPLWDGTPFPGRTLLVEAEQGLGDTLLFMRYLPLARALGGAVTFVCQPALHRLITETPGIGDVIPAGMPLPHFDLHVPLMSLPHRMGTTVETIPPPTLRLSAGDPLKAHWGERLAQGGPGFRIGLAWQGNPKASIDRDRSIPLAALAPLGRIPGVRLISLQKEYGREHIQALAPDFRVEDLGPDLDPGPDAFLDTAAVIANLDLVISCDTAITHLAASLGRPVWLLLCTVPDWRWLAGRDDSPWYPTVRLFRQRRHGDWADVVTDIAAELTLLQRGGTGTLDI